MNFPDNLILEDECVQLRPLQAADLALLQPFTEREPEIWNFSSVSMAPPKGMKDYIETTLALRDQQKEYAFVVFDKRSQRVAGSTRFYDIQLNNQTTQLGYTWYGKDFQRTGLNRHCKFLLLRYAFEQWGMLRVEFRADVLNERSVLAMKNIGCTVEGVLRSALALPNGGRRTSIILSILQSEWQNGIKENLLAKIRP